MSAFKDGLIDALHMASEMEQDSRDQPLKHAMRRTQTWMLARMVDMTAVIERAIRVAQQKTK